MRMSFALWILLTATPAVCAVVQIAPSRTPVRSGAAGAGLQPVLVESVGLGLGLSLSVDPSPAPPRTRDVAVDSPVEALPELAAGDDLLPGHSLAQGVRN